MRASQLCPSTISLPLLLSLVGLVYREGSMYHHSFLVMAGDHHISVFVLCVEVATIAISVFFSEKQNQLTPPLNHGRGTAYINIYEG